jgi:hypothetical protein
MADAIVPSSVTDVELSSAQEEKALRQLSNLGDGPATVVTSIVGDDFETKVKVAGAVQDAEPLRDHLGKTIDLEHYVAQVVEIKDTDNQGKEIVDEQTGEIKTLMAVRIILVAKDGKTYASISTGIGKALENLVGIIGKPHTWPAPIKVKAVEQGPAMRRYLTLKFA